MARTIDTLSRLLEYPDPSTASLAASLSERLAGEHPELAAAIGELAAWLDSVTQGRAEEAYTLLFDLTPVSSLHLGYHLFGEDYARGELLANLVFELRKAGVDKGNELSDFLPTLMRLLVRLDEEEDRRLLLEQLLLPGLEKVNKELSRSKGPWAELLRVLGPYLTAEARLTERSAAPTAEALPHEEPFHA